MKYWVTFKVEGRYIAETEADNIKEAVKNAADEYLDADFGKLEDIDGKPVVVEDEDGKLLDV